MASLILHSCGLMIIFLIAETISGSMPSPDMAKRLGVSPKNRLFKKFYGFVKNYKKDYKDNQTLTSRFKIFRGNMKVIKRLNAGELGTAVYGITEFADMTEKEFMRGNDDGQSCPAIRRQIKWPDKFPKKYWPTTRIPRTCDWRMSRPAVVTPPRDQGACGSCWAFATVAVLESQYQLRKGLKEPARFSEQQILDCSGPMTNCSLGASIEIAVVPIIKEKLKNVITGQDVYPYKAVKGKECIQNLEPRYMLDGLDMIKFRVHRKEIEQREPFEKFMARYVTQHGPIYVQINLETQFYKHGVVLPSNGNCLKKDNKTDSTNHANAIVGFGRIIDKGLNLPYWILKNSWKDRPYVYLYRGKNVCNVAVIPFAITLIPGLFHPIYRRAGCPRRTILPKGRKLTGQQKKKLKRMTRH